MLFSILSCTRSRKFDGKKENEHPSVKDHSSPFLHHSSARVELAGRNKATSRPRSHHERKTLCMLVEAPVEPMTMTKLERRRILRLRPPNRARYLRTSKSAPEFGVAQAIGSEALLPRGDPSAQRRSGDSASSDSLSSDQQAATFVE